MSRTKYYEEMKGLARKVRADHGIESARVLRRDLRRIYKQLGIAIDIRPLGRKIRGAYFNDDFGTHVVLAKGLPADPTVFTMAHELKHHLVDRNCAVSYCTADDRGDPIEIGAEVFAAEFLFPEADFVRELTELGISKGTCDAKALVRVKHQVGTTLSYAGLVKRAERLGFVSPGKLARTPWKKLERELLGLFDYRAWRRRQQRSASPDSR